MNIVSSEEVLKCFSECQKDSDEDVSHDQIEHVLASSWRFENIDITKLRDPYSGFGREDQRVNFTERGLSVSKAVQEIRQSENMYLNELLKQPLDNPPPIFVFIDKGNFYIWDGCKRTFSSYVQGIPTINAYIGEGTKNFV